jgi:hypothetical protein
VSSDSFEDLGRTLATVADGLNDLVDENKQPSAESPAIVEAAGEPCAGDWGAHPGLDVFGTVLPLCWSCADHLYAAATVLASGRGITSLYTLVRGAAEAASLACYLSVGGIVPLERVRREMNFYLKALWEDRKMLNRPDGQGAQGNVAQHRERMAAIARAGQQFGFNYVDSKRYAPHVGDPLPTATSLIDLCITGAEASGNRYRLLSSVAHAQLHGLGRFVHQTRDPSKPDRMLVRLKVDDRDLARHLLPGPVCVATLVEHLGWFLGWDTRELDADVSEMMLVWGRVAQVQSGLKPYRHSW